jgi:TRAP-type mannitol/chloroaromatic compound transport system permease small subunit
MIVSQQTVGEEGGGRDRRTDLCGAAAFFRRRARSMSSLPEAEREVPPSWRPLLATSSAIDRISVFLGKSVMWLILAAILISAGNAIIRKAFDISSNAWLELQWYLFGWAFLVAAAYTLQRNEHIRIDIVSNALPKRVRDWIDILGHIFMLLPLAAVMTYLSWPFFLRAWQSGEMSGSAGGLIIWPARLAILVGFVLLFFQGISELIKRAAVVQGVIADPHATEPAHQVPVE